MSAATSYGYRVRATDAAGNLSGFSNTAGATTLAAAVGITPLIQHSGKDAGTSDASTLTFSAANTAGNWIAVAIRAGQSGQSFTVSDTRANTYRKAVQLNETVDGTSLALYYAESIAGGANTVTVASSMSGGTLRFAIFSYTGWQARTRWTRSQALRVQVQAPNSGTATTTASGDLVLGVLGTANLATPTAGSGFVIQERVPASPNTKLAIEDRVQPSAGPVAAGFGLGSADSWGALVATFRAGSTAPDTQAPTAPTGLTATAASSTQISWRGRRRRTTLG